MKKITLLLILLAVSFGYSQELLTNGDFQTGDATGWVGSTGMPNVVTYDMSNYFNEANVTTPANPWDVNISNVVSLTGGTTYLLTFDAWSDQDRTMIAGIGLNQAPWDSATETVNLTTATQSYSLTLVNPTTSTTCRAIFDMGAAVGYVGIDNVSLTEVVPTCDDGIQNGDETGVDCGGSCPNTCPPTCTDGIMNGNETGVDCGGPDCDPCPTPPTTAAPTPPTRPAADVISLYSDAYTDVASNFDAGWCGANSISEVMIAGNATQHYLNNACQGIVLDSGVDASTFTNLHVDVFIQAGTDLTSSVFNLKFVQQPGGAALEINLNVASSPALVAGSWMSIDVPVDLTTFTGFKEFGITSNLHSKVWYDNLYVHKDTTMGLDDLESVNFNVYPNPSNNVWNVKTSNSVINSIQVVDILGKQVVSLNPNSTEVQIDASTLNTGLYFARIESNSGIKTIKLIKK